MATVTAPRVASADPEALRDHQVAQSLFDRARTLMDAGKFGEACPLLAESQRLDPGGGTLLNFAVCLEQAGKLASAHAAFHDALGQAIKDGREERKSIALERIAALAPRLSTITVEVPAEAEVPGIVVRFDGVTLSRIAWGIPTAVDGGEHRVEATAPGFAPWSTVVQVSLEGQAARVEVQAPSPPSSPKPRALAPWVRCAADSILVGARCVAARHPEPSRPAPATRFSRASWIAGGVSVGLGAAAIATGIAALVLDDQAEADALRDGCNLARAYCPPGHSTGAVSKVATSQTLGWIATGAAVASGLTLLTAVLLPRSKVPVAVTGGASSRAGWLGIEGRF